MKIVYFENELNEGKLAFTVTDGPISDLVAKGILKRGQKYLSKPFKEHAECTTEELLTMYHIDHMEFDNKAKPKALVLNSELAIAEHYRELRAERDSILATLDNLQVRYMVQGKSEIVAEIEKDKEILRAMPANLKIGRVESISALYEMIPTCLQIDYEAKYKQAAK